ncbi:MAG TPA: DUF2777 family protein [Bacillus bacterium]|nr:DUF2777 family protein [Bacillus sp. (in: firmicutes)]
MSLYRKLAAIPFQERAYVEGTIELIGNDWIFFDEVNEEASELQDLGLELEVLINGNWEKGTLIENMLLYLENDFHYLTNGDSIRFKKKLGHSFKQLIEELSEETYLNFVKALNSFGFSLYDCVYCNNFLSFLQTRELKDGMNVVLFDNGDQICVVQHYFYRGSDVTGGVNDFQDRFEFAQNDGKRMVCAYLSS